MPPTSASGFGTSRRNEIWASDKWRELFGFTPSEPLDFERILQRLHPDDREALQQALDEGARGRR